jgi:hypothetical protein
VFHGGADSGELGVEFGLGLVQVGALGFAGWCEVDAVDAEVGDGVDASQRGGEARRAVGVGPVRARRDWART